MFSFLTDYAEQFNHIVIEPFLTKKCNFKCRHCMYSCSPESSDEFMSIETFSKIEKKEVIDKVVKEMSKDIRKIVKESFK